MTPLVFRRCRLALVGLAVACGAARLTAAGPEFWVSARGDDRADGSSVAPWRTLQHARDHIREAGLNAAMTDDIVVNLAAGEYPVDHPIDFGPRDSGANGHSIIYRSAAGPGAACLLGAMPVTGWTVYRGRIWQAKVGKGMNFKTLYENGRRAWIARAPNYAPDPRYPGYHGEYFISEGGTAGSITYKAGDLDPSGWKPQPGLEIWWWGHEGKRNWGMFPCPITAIDPATRKISFTGGLSPASSDERYFVQGLLEFLDAPGEFYLDQAVGTLYYWPQDGDPNQQQIFAPRVGEIFHLDGGAVGAHVHDLKFVGLAVRGTDYIADLVTIIGPPRAAFFLNHTDHIEIRDCHLYQLGNLGIRILNDSDHDTVVGCWIERTGEGGIQVYNDLARADFPAARSEHHLIADCRINDFSEVRVSTHWCGVQLFSVSDSEVAHCEIFDAGRYAISLRGNFSTEPGSTWAAARQPSRGNVFRYIRAYRGGSDSGDMGLLHAAHVNATGGPNINTWEQIWLSDVHAHPSMDDEPPDGIFLDHAHSCENQVLRNIKVADVQGKPFRTNKNPEQTLDNVSWLPGFDEHAMDYASIGLTSEFPRAYRGEAAAAALAPFQEGERWVALGDSITHHGLYHAFVELYYATRFPEREITVINAGIGGDRAVGGARRLEWDVLADKPTTVSVMFGMNDADRFLYDAGQTGAAVVAARDRALDVFVKNETAIVHRLQQAGVKVILLTPSIFDDTAELAAPKETGLNCGLARFADAARELARETGTACVDFFGPMNRLNRELQAANPAFTLTGHDRIHPGAPGYFVMAYLFLHAQHVPALVSRVAIDAATVRVTSAENGEAEIVAPAPAPADRLAFRWREHALPFPVDAAAAPARGWVPFDDELNREILQVTGLTAGRYRVRIDGGDIRIWTSAELAAGVNLAVEVATPQYRQAVEVAKRLRARYDLTAGVLRSIAMAEHLFGPNDGRPFTLEGMQPLLARAQLAWKDKPPAQSIRDAVEHYAERKSRQAEFEATARQDAAEAHALAQPRGHLYEIVPAP